MLASAHAPTQQPHSLAPRWTPVAASVISQAASAAAYPGRGCMGTGYVAGLRRGLPPVWRGPTPFHRDGRCLGSRGHADALWNWPASPPSRHHAQRL